MDKILGWLDNFWYHYKWHVLVGLFIVVFLFVSIGQMIDKEKVDVYILYAGPTAFMAAEIYEIQDAFETIMPDLNGDGQKVVQFIDITVLTDEQIADNMEKADAEGVDYKPDMEYIANARQKFKLQLAAGDAYIVLADPGMYAEDKGVGIYQSLESLGVSAEHAYDEYSVVFRDTDFGSYMPVFQKLPEDTLMCFRTMGVTSKARGKKEQEKHDNQLVMFKEMVNFTLSDGSDD